MVGIYSVMTCSDHQTTAALCVDLANWKGLVRHCNESNPVYPFQLKQLKYEDL